MASVEVSVYKEITIKNALKKLRRKHPYSWDLNIYRGCGHRCNYCYAQYSHRFLKSSNFFDDIFVKFNIADVLAKELQSEHWKGDIVNIGGVTDSYQPAEKTYRLMPDILKIMIEYKNPVIISTKSDLILRDFDLVDRLSGLNYVNVAATVTTLDLDTKRKIEPGAAPPLNRFDVLRQFRKTNASIGLHVMPILPFLTDGEDNLDKIFVLAAECLVDYVLTGTLYLRGPTREHFFRFLKAEFPDLHEKYRLLYRTGGADKRYKTKLYSKVSRLREKYGLSGSYSQPIKEKFKRY
ncbi:MAG: radical SAM protein [Candidatus Aminicenantes bacterium]|nr:MAG: radical SAM protein [Candidatus Aminicenantes bacterium]